MALLSAACVNDLALFLERSEMALDAVAHGLEAEFDERFAGAGVANPLHLTARVRRLERALPELRALCEELVRSKQELVDAAKAQLRSNRDALRGLCARAGTAPPPDDVYADFSEAMAAHEAQQLCASAGVFASSAGAAAGMSRAYELSAGGGRA